MKGGKIVVRREARGPLGEAWSARIDDWIDDGMRLVRLSKEYRRRYRETVCARCSPEQQARRKCAALAPGCSTKSCRHMDRACAAKHRRLIRAHTESHPFYQRLRMNAELERRQLRREGKRAAQGSVARTW